MQVQVNTDRHIDGREATATWVESVVEGALTRYSDQITRVEVHMSDENGPKGGADSIRCMMEARIAHRPPTIVTSYSDNIDSAVREAAEKLHRAVEHAMAKLHA